MSIHAPTAESEKPALSGKPARPHLDFLDGLRAAAALWVVMGHLWAEEFGYKTHPGMKGFLTNWLVYNHLAVAVFIVLSGFCLMLPIAKAGHWNGDALGFFKRRARRILPPYYAALVFSCLVAWASSHFFGTSSLWHQKSVLIANILLLQDVFPEKGRINGPLWSVALEWKIYFLFPAIVWLWLRYGTLITLTVTGVTAYALTGLYHDLRPTVMMAFTSPWYLFLFGMGVCACGETFQKPASRRYWPAFAFVSAMFLAYTLHLYPATAAGNRQYFTPHLPLIDPIMGALASSLMFGLTSIVISSPSKKMPPIILALSWRPLVKLGTFSYSVYLIHFPVIKMGYAMLSSAGLLKHSRLPNEILLTVILLPLILGVAYLFHLAFECPFMSKPGTKIKSERQAEVAAVVGPVN